MAHMRSFTRRAGMRAQIDAQVASCRSICQAMVLSDGVPTPLDVCRRSANTLGMFSTEGILRWLDPCYAPG